VAIWRLTAAAWRLTAAAMLTRADFDLFYIA
jgi:hypothetical protein